MSTARRPGHRWLLAEALADHLMDGRFHNAGANPLSSPLALPALALQEHAPEHADTLLPRPSPPSHVRFQAMWARLDRTFAWVLWFEENGHLDKHDTVEEEVSDDH